MSLCTQSAVLDHCPRLLVFGIDGGTFDLILPWIEQGHLPNLAALLQRGAWGELKSTSPPLTPCAWPTMLCGVNPGRHGLFDFIKRTPGSYQFQLTTAADRKTSAVWQLVNQAGLTSGVLNVPFTFPPDKIEGYMVSGVMGAPDFRPSIVHPPSLAETIEQAIGEYPMDITWRKPDEEFNLSRLDYIIEKRRQIFRHLLSTAPTDLFVAVVNYVDHVQHGFFGDVKVAAQGREIDDIVLYAYQAADRQLGELLEFCGPQTHVLVVSDHGFGPAQQFLNLRRLVLEAGLYHLQVSYQPKSLLRRLIRVVPVSLRRRLPVAVRRPVGQSAAPDQTDWTRTRLYVWTTGVGLSLNVQGREPEGIIPAGQYAQELDRVIARMQEVLARHPELGTVRFEKKEDIYSGTALADSPDLICMPEDEAIMAADIRDPNAPLVLSPEQYELYEPKKRFMHVGNHRLQGVFIAAGPRIRPGSKAVNAELADVTPTMLELLGLQAEGDFDGRVLQEILREAS